MTHSIEKVHSFLNTKMYSKYFFSYLRTTILVRSMAIATIFERLHLILVIILLAIGISRSNGQRGGKGQKIIDGFAILKKSG